LDASTKATRITHKRARERAEYGPSNAQIESRTHLIGDFFNAIDPKRSFAQALGCKCWNHYFFGLARSASTNNASPGAVVGSDTWRPTSLIKIMVAVGTTR
jgi:hypothetical protein